MPWRGLHRGIKFISDDVLIWHERTHYRWIRACFGHKGEEVKEGRVVGFGHWGRGGEVRQVPGIHRRRRSHTRRHRIRNPAMHCNSAVLVVLPRMKVWFRHERASFFDLPSDPAVMTSAVMNHYKALRAPLMSYSRRCHEGVIWFFVHKMCFDSSFSDNLTHITLIIVSQQQFLQARRWHTITQNELVKKRYRSDKVSVE
jgi:hypothetical protein